MPARNIHHAAVIRALQEDGWTITHDPFLIPLGQLVAEEVRLRLLVFDPQQQQVARWIN